MVHREFPDRSLWWRLGRDLLFLTALAGIFSVLFVLGDLMVYGRVNW